MNQDVTSDFLLSMRRGIEREIRSKVSEYEVLQAHDDLYTKVKLKPSLEQVHSRPEDATSAPSRLFKPFRDRHEIQADITSLRRLLNADARERELQVKLCLLLKTTGTVVQEVTIKVPKGRRMRMDVVMPDEVIELKRGSHLLLARCGQASEHMSRQLEAAIRQVEGYGNQLASNQAAVRSIDLKHGIKLDNPNLRLVAGRSLPDARGYSLLNLYEKSNPSLRIYTWDAFLAELERILT